MLLFEVENKDGEIENLADNVEKLFGALKNASYRHDLVNMNKYYRIGDQLAVKTNDEDGFYCYELYSLNRFNEALKLLHGDFRGIFDVLSEDEYYKFVSKLKLIDIHNYCLYSKNGIKLSNNNIHRKYIKVSGDYDVKNHNISTVTKSFLKLQGFEYSFILDLLNVVFYYGFMKKAFYFNGKKDAFKTSFVETILAGCVGQDQFINWEGNLHSEFAYQSFKESQLLVLGDDYPKINGQAWKRVLGKSHNVNKKNMSEYNILNNKTVILTRNVMEPSLYEVLNNRLIVLEFNNNIQKTDPDLYERMIKIWFEDNDALTKEIEQILYDYSEYSKNVSITESIINLESLETVTMQKSIYEIAQIIMVDMDCQYDMIEEYANCGVELTEDDFCKWNYSKFIDILDEIRKIIPTEVEGEISRTNTQKGMNQLKKYFEGFEFGDFSDSKNRYRYCELVNNIDKIMERINLSDSI